MLAAPLTSRDLYELWTDHSGLSCADLSRCNENNEQRGLRQSGSCPAGPHCTMGHRTGRQGTRGPHYQVGSPYRERGSEEGEQRAVAVMDEGAAGRSQWTGLKGRSEACG